MLIHSCHFMANRWVKKMETVTPFMVTAVMKLKETQVWKKSLEEKL